MTSHEISPLRYPGGKGALSGFLGSLIDAQRPRPTTYVEPFAGGAGAALRLLVDEYVDQVVLNDLDPGVAALWRSVFYQTEDFAQLIESAPISIDSWRQHHLNYANREMATDDLELGFSTFFLNRTNRSGILTARPIGGLAQTGDWKMDVRFNRANLARRVRTLGNYRNRVTVSEEDGIKLVRSYQTRRDFVYADPPYLVRGSELYLNTLSWEDHQALAKTLSRSRGRWMVTYDHDPRVRNLFPDRRLVEFTIAHTAAAPHVGREYAVFADSIAIRDLQDLGRGAEYVSSSGAVT